MNTINCQSFKETILQQFEEGNTTLLSTDIEEHNNNCVECRLFYNSIKPQYERLETEKQMEINPYLINKIVLKTAKPTSNILYKRTFAQSTFSLLGVVIISVMVGVGINNFLYSGENSSEELISTTITDAQNETIVNTENDILTLND